VPEIKYIGFELWQVKAGSIFDNVMLTHSLDEAMQFAKDTWGKTIEGEKEMKAQADVCSYCYPSTLHLPYI
jgi:calreticulin